MAATKDNLQKKRKTVPPATRQIILLEAGYKCANPTCRHILTLELHHIIWIKDGGGNEPENLVALCPNCHSLHSTGHIPMDAIRCWKNLLLSLNNHNRASVDVLLVLYEEEKRAISSADQNWEPPFRFTGDGLGMLSGLLTSGLLEISKRIFGGSLWGGGIHQFEVRLTESGKRLVEAWLSGNPEAIKEALSS